MSIVLLYSLFYWKTYSHRLDQSLWVCFGLPVRHVFACLLLLTIFATLLSALLIMWSFYSLRLQIIQSPISFMLHSFCIPWLRIGTFLLALIVFLQVWISALSNFYFVLKASTLSTALYFSTGRNVTLQVITLNFCSRPSQQSSYLFIKLMYLDSVNNNN